MSFTLPTITSEPGEETLKAHACALHKFPLTSTLRVFGNTQAIGRKESRCSSFETSIQALYIVYIGKYVLTFTQQTQLSVIVFNEIKSLEDFVFHFFFHVLGMSLKLNSTN